MTKPRQPRISVITPTFNSGQFISDAIQSVVDQAYSNWELLVVDDGSRDDTLATIGQFAEGDSRIRCYSMATNSGRPAVPRNYGLLHATGQYVAFLDADDVWLPEKLARQTELMERKTPVALSYVLSSYLLPDGSCEGEYPKPMDRYRGSIFKKLYLNNSIPTSGAMVRARVLENLGIFDESPSLTRVEDHDLWLRISRKHPVDYVKKDVLMLYRVRFGSLYTIGFLLEYKRRVAIARKFSSCAGRKLFLKRVLWVPARILFRNLLRPKTILNP